MCRGMKNGVLAAAVGLVAVGGSGAHANIIVNGGFETGDFSGWMTQSSGVLQIATFARTGQYSVQFGSHDLLVNQISQSVSESLVPGQTYRIDMWVYNAGIGDDFLAVGVGLANLFQQTPVSTPLEEWSLVSHTFVQAEVFNDPFGILGYDDIAGFFVDDVSLTLVPSPGSAGVIGLGCFAWTRRRRG